MVDHVQNFVLYWMSAGPVNLHGWTQRRLHKDQILYVVEMAGIEPASRSLCQNNSTSLARLNF